MKLNQTTNEGAKRLYCALLSNGILSAVGFVDQTYIVYVSKDVDISRITPTWDGNEVIARVMIEKSDDVILKNSSPIGFVFKNVTARREYSLSLLSEKLRDPEFRKSSGFPDGETSDILRLSNPPYHTSCQNPFLKDFISKYGKEYHSGEYHIVAKHNDVSVGKTDLVYKAHAYHTKVPHHAIVPFILHYTRPGDIVLDAFCGSGMTGVASSYCSTAPLEYRKALEDNFSNTGSQKPEWGLRYTILGDLSPEATFISAGYNIPFDVTLFYDAARLILNDVRDELGWMYETKHHDGSIGRINYTVWGEIFTCPKCGCEINFVISALDSARKTKSSFPCPECEVSLTKRKLLRVFQERKDPITGQPWKRILFRPVFISYNVGSKTYEKEVSEQDLEVIDRISRLDYPSEVPGSPFPINEMYHGSRLEPKGFTRVNHLFLDRPAHAIASIWRKANAEQDPDTRRMLIWFFEQSILGMSLLNCFKPAGFSQVNQYMSGVYYVGSQHCEVSPWYNLHDPERRNTKLNRINKSFSNNHVPGSVIISTGDSSSLDIPDNCIDYIFTDPPFGENIPYSDLNFILEAWHGVFTSSKTEAIIDIKKKKDIYSYRYLLLQCFIEYFRVLKPGHYATVIFSNSKNEVIQAIQESIGISGFVVADVSTLDKKQNSYHQLTTSSCKQDLVISVYKPIEKETVPFTLQTIHISAVWNFISKHLKHLEIPSKDEIITERTQQMLYDRMTAFFIRKCIAIPISGVDFSEGLKSRYTLRDGMYFLKDLGSTVW